MTMGCLGVHFALSEAEVRALLAHPDGPDRLEHLQEVIEEEFLENQRQFTASSDKAWDAMHRSLTDGGLGWANGSAPLNLVVLGGERLYSSDDYIMTLKTPAQVKAVAAALKGITKAGLQRGYLQIDPDDYGMPLSDVDWEYTWENFVDVRGLYETAAAEGRYVLFTASQ
jgi:hypothetical protein